MYSMQQDSRTLETGECEKPCAEPVRIVIPEGLEELVPDYLATRRAEVPVLMGLLATGDYDGLVFLGHNMKGNGSSYGFPELTRIGREIESDAKRQDKIALAVNVAQLGDYLARVRLAGE